MQHPYRQFTEEADVTSFSSTPVIPVENSISSSPPGHGLSSRQKVRLRAIESESDYFLKFLNVSVLRWMTLAQAVSSVVIFLAQILLYATVTRGYYKAVDFIAIGIWAPLLFFSVACGLTWMSTKSPSGCMIGSAMGFQITTLVLSGLLLFLAVISLIMHGQYRYHENTYDPEVPGRVFCSFMIIAAAVVLVTSIFVSVHFCRAVCCGRQKMVDNFMFDVEAVK